MKQLKISHIHWGFPPVIGGVETHLCMLMPEQVKAGHKVSLLTGAFEGEPVESTYKGVDVHRTPLMDLNWLYKRGLADIGKEFRDYAWSHLKKDKPQIIHTHNMHYFSPDHIKILEEIAGELKAALILTAHNYWDEPLFLDLTLNIKWSHVVAISHFIKREFTGVGFPEDKITVVHHGIDIEKFSLKAAKEKVMKKYPKLKGKKVVFHPARMGLAKGCDTTVKAFKIVAEAVPDAFLVLAGTKNILDWGETQQKDIAFIVRLINTFNLKNRSLIEMFSLDDIPSLYTASEVCLYPSSSQEPFGLTMLEAMASGKPLVVTHSGGMPEIVKEGVNGFVVPIRNHEDLAARIIELLQNPDLAKRMGMTGRKMTEEVFNTAVMAQNTQTIYEQCL
jgi:glycosyltransferase involved in cell wall biosynthesis